jgi:hypothetical protein
VKFYDWLDARDLELNLCRHPQEGRWSAVLSYGCGTMVLRREDGGLTSANGQGDSPETAVSDLASAVMGRCLVVVLTERAGGGELQSMRVPGSLTT